MNIPDVFLWNDHSLENCYSLVRKKVKFLAERKWLLVRIETKNPPHRNEGDFLKLTRKTIRILMRRLRMIRLQL